MKKNNFLAESRMYETNVMTSIYATCHPDICSRCEQGYILIYVQDMNRDIS